MQLKLTTDCFQNFFIGGNGQFITVVFACDYLHSYTQASTKIVTRLKMICKTSDLLATSTLHKVYGTLYGTKIKVFI